MDFKRFKNRLDKLFPKECIYIAKYTTHIYIHKIMVKSEKCAGIGTAIMSKICEFADKNKIDVKLSPTNAFGSNIDRLINFYAKFGFIFEEEGDEMIRKFN